LATIRYRAPSNLSYTMAMVELVKYARTHPEPPFTFEPLTLDRLENEGLVISGPELDGVSDLLKAVPGLVEVPA
jgi:hypothetical protein